MWKKMFLLGCDSGNFYEKNFFFPVFKICIKIMRLAM